MPSFLSDGISIAYQVHGDLAVQKPILLIHGFGSSGQVNWVATGWVEVLREAGYCPITIDNRGHGASQKLYDEGLYYAHKMAEDAVHLLDHLDIERAPVIGYSMGARIAAFLALGHRHRVTCVIFGGMGTNLITGLGDSDEIIAALRAPKLSDVTGATGRQFRTFADHTKSDREALAACMVSSRESMSEAQVRSIDVPILVAVGEADEMAGSAQDLAALLPQGEAFIIPRRTHMLATGDARFKGAALAFLAAHDEPVDQV